MNLSHLEGMTSQAPSAYSKTSVLSGAEQGRLLPVIMSNKHRLHSPFMYK